MHSKRSLQIGTVAVSLVGMLATASPVMAAPSGMEFWTDDSHRSSAIASVVQQDEGDLGAEVAGPGTVVRPEKLQFSAAAFQCGSRCDNKSPEGYAVINYGAGHPRNVYCGDDAVTIDVERRTYYVELRYSPFCQTAWIRTDAPTGSGHYYYAFVEGHTGFPCTSSNDRIRVNVPAGSGIRYSNMVNDAGLYARGVVGYPSTSWQTVCY